MIFNVSLIESEFVEVDGLLSLQPRENGSLFRINIYDDGNKFISDFVTDREISGVIEVAILSGIKNIKKKINQADDDVK